MNWSCKLKTAISDIEVEYQDITEPTKLKIPNHSGEYTFGILQSFAYKVKDEDKEVNFNSYHTYFKKIFLLLIKII